MTLLIQSSCVRNSSNIYIIRVNVMYLKAIISSCIQSVCKYLECFLKQRVDLGHTRALVHQIQLNGLQHCSANCFHSNVLNNTTMMNILSSTFFKFFFFFYVQSPSRAVSTLLRTCTCQEYTIWGPQYY